MEINATERCRRQSGRLKNLAIITHDQQIRFQCIELLARFVTVDGLGQPGVDPELLGRNEDWRRLCSSSAGWSRYGSDDVVR